MANQLEILDDVPVSPNLRDGARDVTCFCPTTCLLGDGSVVCSYRSGREKHSRDGILVSQRSLDGGRTWLEPVVIYDGMGGVAPQSVHTGALCVLGGESILAVFTAVEAKQPDAYIFSETGRQLAQRLYVSHSHDGGASWTSAAPKHLANVPHNFYIGSHPFLLTNGTVFLPIEATLAGGVEIILGTVSTDGGASWEPVWTCAADPVKRVGYGDPRFAQLPDGRLVMLLWCWTIEDEQTLAVHRSFSEDQGRSWSTPTSTGVLSQIMTPLALDEARMIAVSNVRTRPEGSRLWQSMDGGESWDVDHPFYMWDPYAERMQGAPLEKASPEVQRSQESLWASLPSFTFGTPELLRLSESEFLLTYYGTVRGVTHVRACRFRL